MSSGPLPVEVLQDADVRMGFHVQEIYCSCTKRGRGQELAKRAVSCDRALMPLNGKGKEGGMGREVLRLQCGSEKVRLFTATFEC